MVTTPNVDKDIVFRESSGMRPDSGTYELTIPVLREDESKGCTVLCRVLKVEGNEVEVILKRTMYLGFLMPEHLIGYHRPFLYKKRDGRYLITDVDVPKVTH